MLLSRRHAVIAAVGLGIAVAVPAYALQSPKFTPAALADAQKAGKAVLVEVSAPWCPVCKAQKPVLDSLFSKDKYKSFVTFDVDFDSQKDALKALNVQKQSTLIVFKGDKEVGRSTGVTDAAAIEALIAKAL